MSSPEEALECRPDIVVEALPGVEAARRCLNLALEPGLPVVTANKADIAADWTALAPRLLGPRRQLRYTVTVGGGVPMLETLERIGRRTHIVGVRGVLNGTCNYILDQHRSGASFEEAVSQAQLKGFAESDPSQDLSGADSARKVEILGRIAFGRNPECQVLEGVSDEALQAFGARPQAQVRLVAEAERTSQGFSYRIRLLVLPPEDFLAGTRDAENRLEIHLADRTVLRLAGLGAGRIPTATAVVADVLEHARVLHTAEPATDAPETARVLTA